MRLAAVIAHPVQYYAPIFRALATKCDLTVFFGQDINSHHHEKSGFGVKFEWDLDLVGGYSHRFLHNVAKSKETDSFFGCDTPDIGNELRAGDFDAVLIAGWYQKFLLQALLAAKRLGIATLVRGDSQISTPRSFAKRLLVGVSYPVFLRSYDAALVVGRRSQEFLLHHRYPLSRQFASPHCVDNSWFASRATPAAAQALRQSLRIDETDRLVLFAGKLVAFKRPLDVVEALKLVRDGGVRAHLLVAGSGELDGQIRERASSLGVPLHMLGFQNQTAMPAAYAAADVLALPSTGRETWGLVCNEALACGTPVVVSEAVGCAPDLAADGVSGRQHALGDVVGLANAVAATLLTPPPLAKIAETAARHDVRLAVDGIVTAAEAVSRRR